MGGERQWRTVFSDQTYREDGARTYTVLGRHGGEVVHGSMQVAKRAPLPIHPESESGHISIDITSPFAKQALFLPIKMQLLRMYEVERGRLQDVDICLAMEVLTPDSCWAALVETFDYLLSQCAPKPRCTAVEIRIPDTGQQAQAIFRDTELLYYTSTIESPRLGRMLYPDDGAGRGV